MVPPKKKKSQPEGPYMLPYESSGHRSQKAEESSIRASAYSMRTTAVA